MSGRAPEFPPLPCGEGAGGEGRSAAASPNGARICDTDFRTLEGLTQGFRVLRFANNDVWDRPAWVIAEVRARLAAPHPPAPSPQGRGGESAQ